MARSTNDDTPTRREASRTARAFSAGRRTALVLFVACSSVAARADSFTRTVAAADDDAEQTLVAGLVGLGGTSVSLGMSGLLATVAGFRFGNVAVPRGATVTGARLVFTAADTDLAPASFTIEGVASSDPVAFTTSPFDLSARPRTTASVDWNGVSAWTGGASGPAQTTPELTAIVQEIVDRSDWVPGKAMAFLVTGTGQRDARTFDNGSGAARLEIEFSPLVTPDIALGKTVEVTADPINGGAEPKSIPGGTMRYVVTASNYGGGSADADSVRIVEPVPAGTRLYVDDAGGPGSGPVAFSDGSVSSGLSYTFQALGHPLDDVDFSRDGGVTYDYVPTPAADGTDSAVTHLQIAPKGSFSSASGGNAPAFDIEFRVLVE